MGVLLKLFSKKVSASTLVEVIVASVLVIVLFTIASLSLNNIIKSTIKSNTSSIENTLNKLQYLYKYQKITSNYVTNLNNWEVKIIKQKGPVANSILLEATNIETNKRITRNLRYDFE